MVDRQAVGGVGEITILRHFHTNPALMVTTVVSFVLAVAFVFGAPHLLIELGYLQNLVNKIGREEKTPSQANLETLLIFVGGGFFLGWLMWRITGHYESLREYAPDELRYAYSRRQDMAFQWMLAFPLAGMVAYRMVKNSIDGFSREKAAKQTIKTAYQVKDWATFKDIENRLSTNSPDDTEVGIYIGGGTHWNEKGHMLCVGGSGQGKGVNLVLPALLSDGLIALGTSVVCLDPKGENAAVAAAHFKRNGYDVHVLNPFGIPEIAHLGNSRFNPIDLIDRSSNDATKLYDMLAMAIHNRKGDGDNSFFDNRCRQYISLYIAFAHRTRDGNFEKIAKWLGRPADVRALMLNLMMKDAGFEGRDMAEAILSRMTGDANRMEESIFATIEEAINIFKDKNLLESLSVSDFDMRTIARRPTAIFVCIPFEELGYYSAWVRMLFGSLLRTMTKHYNPERKVLVLLDEFPQLSYMDEVVRSLAVLRGYNVTLWPIVQSLTQLKDVYNEKWEMFLSSAIVKHWLSNGADNFTADYITKRMPQAIKFIGNNADGSPREMQTKLMEHNDVINSTSMICELSGLSQPIRFAKEPYYTVPDLNKNASPNPFYN